MTLRLFGGQRAPVALATNAAGELPLEESVCCDDRGAFEKHDKIESKKAR